MADEQTVPEFKIKDMKHQLYHANGLFSSVNKEVNGNNPLSRILGYILPHKKDQLLWRLGSQNNIVRRELNKLEKVISSFGNKVERIEKWQDGEDSMIIEYLAENREISSKYSQYSKDKGRLDGAYKIVLSINPINLENKATLRKAMRELDARLAQEVHSYNTNYVKVKFYDDEIEKLEGFKQGLRNFYYTAKTLDNGLGLVVDHTDKILLLFKDIKPEIRFLSQYTQQGMDLWDDVVGHISDLETVYFNLTTQRPFMLDNPNMKLSRGGKKKEEVRIGLELADKLLQGGKDGNGTN